MQYHRSYNEEAIIASSCLNVATALAVLGKLSTPILLLYIKQRKW